MKSHCLMHSSTLWRYLHDTGRVQQNTHVGRTVSSVREEAPEDRLLAAKREVAERAVKSIRVTEKSEIKCMLQVMR